MSWENNEGNGLRTEDEVLKAREGVEVPWFPAGQGRNQLKQLKIQPPMHEWSNPLIGRGGSV